MIWHTYGLAIAFAAVYAHPAHCTMLSDSPVAKEPHSFQEPRTAAEQGCTCAGTYVSSIAIRGMASLYSQCTEVELGHGMPRSAAKVTCVCLADSANVSECACGALRMLHVGSHKQGPGVLQWQRLCQPDRGWCCFESCRLGSNYTCGTGAGCCRAIAVVFLMDAPGVPT